MSGGGQRSKNDLACTPVIRGGQKEWFLNLRKQVAAGKPYVFSEAFVPHEILEAFDLPYVINEWWSGLVAARRQSPYYFEALEAAGFHAGLERYTALAYATVVDDKNPDPPWGGLPKPAFTTFAISSSRPHNIPRWEQLSKLWGVPCLPFEVPSTGRPMASHWWDVSRRGWEQIYPTYHLDYMVENFKEFIRFCEDATKTELDFGKLREAVDRGNQQQRYFEDIRTAIIENKSPVSMNEQLGNVMTIQWRRGSKWALNAAKMFRDEVIERVRNKQWICPNEKVRLLWLGRGLWQNTSFYRAFEETHGAVFVRSMYMSIAIDGYPRYGRDPLRALASRYCGIGLLNLDWDIHDAKAHGVAGVVAAADNVAGRQRAAFEKAGMPLLALNVDLVDGRTWDGKALTSQMTDFLEQTLRVPRQVTQ